MNAFDWIPIAFTIGGIVCLMSSYYEWTRFWRGRSINYWPDKIGLENTRMLFAVVGVGALAVGIGIGLKSYLSVNLVLGMAIGCVISLILSTFLYQYCRNKFIGEWINARTQRGEKQKRKNNDM